MLYGPRRAEGPAYCIRGLGPRIRGIPPTPVISCLRFAENQATSPL